MMLHIYDNCDDSVSSVLDFHEWFLAALGKGKPNLADLGSR